MSLIAYQVCGAPGIVQQIQLEKAVLVTGASSGIGPKITEKLSANGFYFINSSEAIKS